MVSRIPKIQSNYYFSRHWNEDMSNSLTTRRDVNLQPEITSVVCEVRELKIKEHNRDHVSLLTRTEDVAFLLPEGIYRLSGTMCSMP